MEESEVEVCNTLLFVAIPKSSLFHERSICQTFQRLLLCACYQDINIMLYLSSMPCL